MNVLAGDIGGTYTRLAVFESHPQPTSIQVEEILASRDHPSLNDALRAFVARHAIRCDRACFGVPGPVYRGRVTTTNLPWQVDAASLAACLGLAEVLVINDLEAVGYGIGTLAENELATIRPGRPGRRGNAAIVAPGTGLGEAGLFWDGKRYRPFASEGGHVDFAPSGELQRELLDYLAKRYEHVSWERVVSGPGLVNIYRFLRARGEHREPGWLTTALAEGDPAAAISDAAIARRCPVCVEALDLFVACYGAQAGNTALAFLATGGVYLGGGITPKILPRLLEPTFALAFCAKGRMRPVLEAIEVRAFLRDDTGLRGCARLALESAAPEHRRSDRALPPQ